MVHRVTICAHVFVYNCKCWRTNRICWNEQAVKKAKSYLSHLAYSESGLLKQLDYEGFTPEQARFGVDHSDADWFAEAAEKAASYMEHLAYSRDGLYRQLEYEGFTPDQIEFALADVGY